MDPNVGVCGLHCDYCPIYRREEYRCKGCNWVNEQLKKVKGSHMGCAFWECAAEKNLKCCFLCEEFPCGRHYEKEAVYTSKSLDNWKELKRTGLRFGK